MSLRADLKSALENPTGTACGESVDDILNDTEHLLDPANEFTKAEASDAVSQLRRVIEELKGLVKS